MKETFIVRTEWFSSLELLSQKGKAEILDALFLTHLGRNEEVSFEEPMTQLCWNFMEANINYNTKKYTASVENGKKGGRPRTQQEPKKNPTITQEKPNNNLKVKPNNNLIVTGTVTETVTGIVIETGNVIETEPVNEIVFGNKKINLEYTDLEAQKMVEAYLK
jgi:hypothetical protein